MTAPRHALGLLPGLVLAAMGVYGADPAPLFADEDIIDLTVEAPLTTLMDVRPDKAELKGTVRWIEPDGSEKRVSVKLRTRGNYRRAKNHCDFAPIRLNFRKSEVSRTLFDDQDKLKLVTHCRTWDREYQSLLLREYLAYRLLRKLTDVAYDVRLFSITYFDTEIEDEYTRFGFVIEDDDAMARRNGLKFVKQNWLSHDDHDRARQNFVHVFQYMIGNTEYSLVNPEPEKDCCHNTDVLSADKNPPYVAVPFDFDFSGLVNAPYAEPNPKYPINRVRMRFYKGLCANNDILPATLDLFRNERDVILGTIAVLESQSSAGASAARSARRYVKEFYEILDDPAAVEEQLVERCLTPEADERVEPPAP